MSDPTSLPNFPPPADEHPLRGRVLDALTDLGLRPDIDADGDVSFTVGEPAQQLFIRCQDGDFPIMRVFGQWMIGDQVPDDHELRLQRCNDFSLQLNLVKVGLVATEVGENLVVSGEHIVPVGVEVGPLFQVTVNIIMEVVRMWHTSFLPPEEQERLAREAGQVPPGEPTPPEDGYQPRHGSDEA